jgi:hypothetical protein
VTGSTSLTVLFGRTAAYGSPHSVQSGGDGSLQHGGHAALGPQ